MFALIHHRLTETDSFKNLPLKTLYSFNSTTESIAKKIAAYQNTEFGIENFPIWEMIKKKTLSNIMKYFLLE